MLRVCVKYAWGMFMTLRTVVSCEWYAYCIDTRVSGRVDRVCRGHWLFCFLFMCMCGDVCVNMCMSPRVYSVAVVHFCVFACLRVRIFVLVRRYVCLYPYKCVSVCVCVYLRGCVVVRRCSDVCVSVSLHRHLSLSNNQLSGDIPAALGSLTKLTWVAAVCVCCNLGARGCVRVML